MEFQFFQILSIMLKESVNAVQAPSDSKTDILGTILTEFID